jgi:NADH-quinone oxidoreductase subunit E
MSREFSPDLIERIEAVKTRYPSPQAALLPVLHLVQNETGFITAAEERAVASILGIPPIKVREVVTFYTMFTRRPLGRFHLQVCSNLSCSLADGEKILRHIQAKLGIGVGETTPDGKYTLTAVECLGACEQAPCMMVNYDYHGILDPEKVDRILGELK